MHKGLHNAESWYSLCSKKIFLIIVDARTKEKRELVESGALNLTFG